MTRIVQVSGTHLSRSHAYFAQNFAAFRAAMLADPTALIVHSGDRALRHRGMEIVWGPATAMANAERGLARHHRLPRPGYIECTLAPGAIRHRLVEPPGMFLTDMTQWTAANGGTVTTLPPSAPADTLLLEGRGRAGFRHAMDLPAFGGGALC